MRAQNLSKPIFWGAADIIIEQTIQLVLLFVLSRNISAQIFGLLAAIQVITFFSMLVIDSGLGASIVRYQVTERKKIDAIFTLNFVTAVVAVFVLFSQKSFFLNWFSIEEYSSIFLIGLLGILLDSYGVTQYNQLKRDLRFKTTTLITAFSTVPNLVIVLFYTRDLKEEFLILLVILVPRLLRTFAYLISGSYNPRISFKFRSISEERKYGFKLLYLAFLNWINKGALVFFVGGTLGPTQLGYLNRAQSLQAFVGKTLSTFLNRIGFSSFSKLQNDVEEVVKLYNKGVLLMVCGIAMTSLTLQFFAKEIVEIILGEGWEASAVILVGLVPLAAALPFYELNRTLLTALGDLKMMLRLDTLDKLFLVCSLIFLHTMPLGEILFILAAIRLLFLSVSFMVVRNKLRSDIALLPGLSLLLILVLMVNSRVI
ncbi:oligosaccharide flippase family protein [Akkermansiaceae bacterium]|nr:oligosaccharide flippase family protein [Akkermansiaceae bacterium]